MEKLGVWPSYGLLVLGVLAMLLSTRQRPASVRLAIWAAGGGLLAAAIVMRPPGGGAGLAQIVGDLAAHWRSPDHSLLWQVLTDNWVSVGNVAPPMLDVASTIAIALAVVALVALTPGERIERALRPAMIGLLGAVAGGFLALVLVASGLAGYQKDRVFAGVFSDEHVHDGDTLKIGDFLLRLNGIDAPEKDQTCFDERDCAERSRQMLSEMINGKVVICSPPPANKPRTPPKEAIGGRPIVSCLVRKGDGSSLDVNAEMIRRGGATPFRNRDGLLRSEYDEGSFSLGCMLRPHLWRNNRASREQYLAGKWRSEDVVGTACPPTPQ